LRREDGDTGRVRLVRKTFVGVALMGILTSMILGAGPAGASTTGYTYFNCTVNLPVWPTPTKKGPVDCNGTATVSLRGNLTNGQAYTASGSGVKFDGHADWYLEKCTAGLPLNGSAAGTTYAYKLLGGGTATGLATAASKFSWSRVGATAVVTIPPGGSVTFANGKKAVGTGTGRAVAVFQQKTPGVVGGRTCSAPGTQVSQVTGVALFPS
jgi:hypothetical protein